MKFLIKLIIVGVGAYFALQFFPWWGCLAVAGIASLIIKTKGSGSFFSGFLGVGLAWFIASYTFYLVGEKEFYDKIAKLFFLPKNGMLLISVASFILALAGGLSAYSANAFRNILKNPNAKTKSRYPRPDYNNYSR